MADNLYSKSKTKQLAMEYALENNKNAQIRQIIEDAKVIEEYLNG